MPSVHPEIEYKFEAVGGADVPELTGIDDVATVEGPFAEVLDATYLLTGPPGSVPRVKAAPVAVLTRPS